MTVPSTTTIAKWRHVVRVVVRLVGVLLVGYGFVSLSLLLMGALLTKIAQPQSLLQPWWQVGRSLPWISMIVVGTLLIRLDRWLARLIVPMPSKGCPSCGYWIGSRELGVCPECGLELGSVA